MSSPLLLFSLLSMTTITRFFYMNAQFFADDKFCIDSEKVYLQAVL